MINWLRDDKNEIKVTVGFASILVIGISIFYWCHFRGPISSEHRVWAEFGTFFGGLTGTAVAFVALLALLRTIDINKEGLKDAREAISAQNLLLSEQLAETTFLGLLEIHINTLNSVTNPPQSSFRGIHFIKPQLQGIQLIGRISEELNYKAARGDFGDTDVKYFSQIFNEIYEENPFIHTVISSYVAISRYIFQNIKNIDQRNKLNNILLSYSPLSAIDILIAYRIHLTPTDFNKAQIDNLNILENHTDSSKFIIWARKFYISTQ